MTVRMTVTMAITMTVTTTVTMTMSRNVGHIQILFCILPQEEEKLSASRHDLVKGEVYEERITGMLFL
jgi:hypothetical protein